jgi:hypothetical protein
MSASIRRHAAVVLLIAAAGVAGAALVGHEAPAPAEPAIASLVGGTSWRVERTYAPGDAGGPYQQWLVRDPSGTEALLYVGATSRVQTMARWTGELGYQGEGYLVTGQSEERVRLADGSSDMVSRVLAQRQGDRLLLEYAVVGPQGEAVSAMWSLPGSAWDALTGRDGPYYMVRVTVAAGRGTAADRLLADVLPPLVAAARAG